MYPQFDSAPDTTYKNASPTQVAGVKTHILLVDLYPYKMKKSRHRNYLLMNQQ